MRVTIQETSTEIQPVYDGYPSSQHGSLSRTEVQRSYSNGHTASNATKELDDLMASLSEFKVHNLTMCNAIHNANDPFGAVDKGCISHLQINKLLKY